MENPQADSFARLHMTADWREEDGTMRRSDHDARRPWLRPTPANPSKFPAGLLDLHRLLHSNGVHGDWMCHTKATGGAPTLLVPVTRPCTHRKGNDVWPELNGPAELASKLIRPPVSLKWRWTGSTTRQLIGRCGWRWEDWLADAQEQGGVRAGERGDDEGNRLLL